MATDRETSQAPDGPRREVPVKNEAGDVIGRVAGVSDDEVGLRVDMVLSPVAAAALEPAPSVVFARAEKVERDR